MRVPCRPNAVLVLMLPVFVACATPAAHLSSPAPIAARDVVEFERVGIFRPYVVAEVAGVRGVFLLDTGAQGHHLNSAFALRAGIAPHDIEYIRGVAGTSFAVGVADDVPIVIGHHELLLDRVKVSPNAADGADGYLSPQRLPGFAYTVFDFPARQLMFVEEAFAHQVLSTLAGRGCANGIEQLASTPDNSARRVFVNVAIEEKQYRMVLDTGADRTSIFAGDSLVNAKVVAHGVGGVPIHGRDEHAVALTLGSLRIESLGVTHVQRRVPDKDGLLGANALVGFVVAMPSEARDPVYICKPMGQILPSTTLAQPDD